MEDIRKDNELVLYSFKWNSYGELGVSSLRKLLGFFPSGSCFCHRRGFYCFYVSLEAISEKAMALHSSTLAWKIPWTEGPGRLQSMGSLRVGHD